MRTRDNSPAEFGFERVGSIERGEPAVDHEGDAIAKFVHVIHVVRREHDRFSLVAQFSDDGLDDARVDGVEACCRLV